MAVEFSTETVIEEGGADGAVCVCVCVCVCFRVWGRERKNEC